MLQGDHLRLYRAALRNQLQNLQQGCLKLHLPHPLGKMRRIAGTHFHFTPELFLQVGGFTDFSFPKEKIRLPAGAALLVPRALPHGEVAQHAGTDFLNVVIICLPEGLSIHAATKDAQGSPHSFGMEYYRTEKGRRIERYFDDLAEFYPAAGQLKKTGEASLAIRGLFQAALAGILLILEEDQAPERAAEHLKISACRKYILSNIHDASLSVKKLAGQIHCSPDYLSHLFVTETGGCLTDFIHQVRIGAAQRHLQNPALLIKEVAWACGFRDQGYFTRLFKRLTGKTPKEFRKHQPTQDKETGV